MKRASTAVVAALLVGIAIGWALGWLIGSYTTCTTVLRSCEANVAAIEAAGVWVGGLGTIAAVLFAAASLRQDQKALNAAEESKHREASREARRVGVELSWTDFNEITVTRLGVTVTNWSALVASGVTVALPGPGVVLRADLPPSASKTVSVEALRLAGVTPAIGPNQRAALLAEIVDAARLEFEMGTTTWARVGTADPSPR